MESENVERQRYLMEIVEGVKSLKTTLLKHETFIWQDVVDKFDNLRLYKLIGTCPQWRRM